MTHFVEIAYQIIDGAYKRLEYLGGAAGATVGVMRSSVIYDVSFTLIMAFLTGALGALGAHLVKIIITKLKQKKDEKE